MHIISLFMKLACLIFYLFAGYRPGYGDTSISNTIIGSTPELFIFTFITSILSASFGMAKSLKLGVCRTMASEGPLDGLLTGKFILLVLTCAGILVSEGVTPLSPGVSLVYDLAYDSGMLQSELFTSRNQNLVLAKLPNSGFWRYGQFFK